MNDVQVFMTLPNLYIYSHPKFKRQICFQMSKIVFKRFYKRTRGWSITAKELYWSGCDEWMNIHKVVVLSRVVYKIVIKGLLLDNG
jgi:hypothetical protein